MSDRTDQLPRWAQELRDKHPTGEMPTHEDPIPAWLEDEVREVPLWQLIRRSDEQRTEHPFLLVEEVHRQPGQWREIIDERHGDVTALAGDLLGAELEEVIFTGCGSAFFTALHSAYLMERLTPWRARAVESYELLHYFPPADPRRTLVAAHSGTGGSIETVEAVGEAARRGCRTLGLTNTEDTPLERAADRTLTYVTEQRCGPCTSVVSTRVLLLSMLAVEIADRTGRAGTAELRDALTIVPDVGARFLESHEDHLADLARRYAEIGSVFVVGSGPNYFSAREGVLKLEEEAILVSNAYRTGDYHHDALSLVGPERLVVVIEAAGDANDRVVDVLRSAREAGAPTIAVTWTGTDAAEVLARGADHHIELSGALPELIVPIPMTLVFQLLGYYLGLERGYNPDTLRTDHLPNARAWLTSFPLGTH